MPSDPVQDSTPPASADSSVTAGPAAGLRGLRILKAALLVEMVVGLVAGIGRAYMMSQYEATGWRSSSEQSLLMMVLNALHYVFIGTEVAQLVALQALSGAPPQARIGGLSRLALGLRVVMLLQSLFYTGIADTLLRPLLEGGRTVAFYTYLNTFSTALELGSTIAVVELLLRLQRFAAPDDRQLAESANLARASVIGSLVLLELVGFASFPLIFRFFGTGATARLIAQLVRRPFALLFSGLMVWLVHKTETTLQQAQDSGALRTAAAAGRTVSETTRAAAYRNMLFGALWAVGGIVVTLATYLNAHQLGGRYAIAYGAIFFGIVQFFRGMTQLGERE